MERSTRRLQSLLRRQFVEQRYKSRTRAALQQRLKELRRRQDRIARFRLGYYIGAIACFAVGVVSVFHPLGSDPTMSLFITGVAGFYGLFILGFALAFRPSYLASEIRETEDELDLLNMSESSDVQKAEKLFKVHQNDLKRYYDQTLRHSAGIFYVGIGCLVVGFTITVVTLLLVRQDHSSNGVLGQAITAALGAITGILTNFVAVIYLRIYSGTIKSLTEFHNRLVNTHHLHFANTLVARIEDKSLREETLRQAALNLFRVPASNSKDSEEEQPEASQKQ